MLAAVVGGCAEPAPRLDPQTVTPPRTAVLVFVDGLARDPLIQMLDAGELPNLDRIFARGGVRVVSAVTAMPAMTFANSVTLMTGTFPGHHGVLGNQWFDPDRVYFRDYGSVWTFEGINEDFETPTIYERLSDRMTANALCHTRRGVSYSVDHPIHDGLSWASGDFLAVDRRSGACIPEIAQVANREGRWPTLITVYFPAVDEIGHRYGPASKEYADALRNMDRGLGQVAADLKALGRAKSCYWVLTTDHGLSYVPPAHYVDVAKWLEQNCGMRAVANRGPGWGTQAVVTHEGRLAAIHLRGDVNFSGDPKPEDVECIVHGKNGENSILDMDATALVCFRDGTEAIAVCSRSGRGRIARKFDGPTKRYRYTVVDGDDPLELEPRAASMRGAWQDGRAWLAATANARFPDFVLEVVEMFDSPRAGDIVVFAKEGWGFGVPYPGHHGGATIDDMRVTYFFAGPDLPPGGRIDTCRLVDVMPTILDLLGESQRLAGEPAIDGVSVAAALRSAGAAE